MQKNEKPASKLRLQVTGPDNRTFMIKSAAGRLLGHAVAGCQTGPGLLVAGAGEDTDRVFQRVLELPAMGSINGRLVLLRLDRLDDADDRAELDRLSDCLRPVTDTFFLSAVDLSGADNSRARVAALFEAVVEFCAKHGVDLSADRPDRHIIRDYAS